MMLSSKKMMLSKKQIMLLSICASAQHVRHSTTFSARAVRMNLNSKNGKEMMNNRKEMNKKGDGKNSDENSDEDYEEFDLLATEEFDLLEELRSSKNSDEDSDDDSGEEDSDDLLDFDIGCSTEVLIGCSTKVLTGCSPNALKIRMKEVHQGESKREEQTSVSPRRKQSVTPGKQSVTPREKRILDQMYIDLWRSNPRYQNSDRLAQWLQDIKSWLQDDLEQAGLSRTFVTGEQLKRYLNEKQIMEFRQRLFSMSKIKEKPESQTLQDYLEQAGHPRDFLTEEELRRTHSKKQIEEFKQTQQKQCDGNFRAFVRRQIKDFKDQEEQQ